MLTHQVAGPFAALPPCRNPAVGASFENPLMRTRLAAAVAMVILLPAVPAAASPGGGGPAGPAAAPVTFALLGDTPYGDAQRAVFPALVDQINGDAHVRFVLHAGDVKNGSSTCDDARFADLAALYDTFADPFVLTPGDNEWTDCHRTAAGGYLPTERLEAVRRFFFPVAGQTAGGRQMPVQTQADDPRHAAALDWIDTTFATARSADAAGVLLLMQAEPTATPGYTAIRERILAQARSYGRPVLLVHGDEHAYEIEPGYGGVSNLTRLETFGDTATQWLRVTADPRTAEVFSWQPQST